MSNLTLADLDRDEALGEALDALYGSTRATFLRRAAIDLEELTLAAYIGQGANLTRDAVGGLARLVSVEARQAAWLRDIAGEMPAPHVADPARSPDDVLKALRDRSYIL